MAKLLAVFGSTGMQGGSVIDHVLHDRALSSKYRLRAITSDASSDKAKALAKLNVDVVQASMTDISTLGQTVAGVDAVFIMTTASLDYMDPNIEYTAAKNVADAAVEAGVNLIIFATLPSVTELSHGKYDQVYHFDSKHRAEQYIRGLPVKSAFVAPAFYASNFTTFPFLAPQRHGDEWFSEWHIPASSPTPVIDAQADIGKFVGAILADPARCEGKTLCAAAKTYSIEELINAMSVSAGQKISYKQISAENFKARLPGGSEAYFRAFSYGPEFGFMGPDTAELIDWSIKQVPSKLNSFEDYLKAHPFTLP